MRSETKQEQKNILKLYGKEVWSRIDLLQSSVMVRLFFSRKVLSFTFWEVKKSSFGLLITVAGPVTTPLEQQQLWLTYQ